MIVIFEVVRWKNLLSTGNSWTEVKLNVNKTTLIVGKNGHGKSTLLDAITFALFGKPFRKVNLGMMINSINMKDCLVELEFRVGPRKYWIRRGMSPGIFEIYIDGVLQNQDSISRDYQRYMENNILKFNLRSFRQIVILGSKSFIPFMKLGPQDRRAIIENLLDIQIFSLMNTVAKADLIKAREALEDNKRNTAQALEQIELQKRYVEDSKKNNQEQIDKRQSEINSHEAEINRIQSEIHGFTSQINDLNQQIMDVSTVQEKLRQLDGYETKIDANKNKAEREVQFFSDNDNCPTCHQEIDEQFKQEFINKTTQQTSQYSQALQVLAQQKDKLNRRLSVIQETSRTINGLNLEITKRNYSIKHTQQYIERLRSEINEIASAKPLSDDMMKVSSELVDRYQSFVDARKGLIENRAYHEVAVNLLKDGGIKAEIIKQYLPVINKQINKYLGVMDFFVNFELDEEFNETIKSRHRDQFTYDSFSEGEKQKIDIALLFAWRAVAKLKNSMNTNLLILDEIFDSSLDGEGADLVLEILASMSENTNVFVISHRELLHDKFEHTIKFEKINNFSQIVTNEE